MSESSETNTTTEQDEEYSVVYTLILTEREADAVRWVGGRYCWSDALLSYLYRAESDEGVGLTQEDMDHLKSQFDADTEGGHNYFPCLDPGSSLCRKLSDLYCFGEEPV